MRQPDHENIYEYVKVNKIHFTMDDSRIYIDFMDNDMSDRVFDGLERLVSNICDAHARARLDVN